MKALQNRAELLLFKCRKELCFGKLGELKKKCNKEQDDVLRMEGSLFAKLRRDHEERLAEEKQETVRAKLEPELAEKEMVEMERKIVSLEGVSSIYNADDLNDAERELHEWCSFMEQAHEVLVLTNKCLREGWVERMCSYSNPGNLENCIVFQEDVEELYRMIDKSVSMVGRVR